MVMVEFEVTQAEWNAWNAVHSGSPHMVSAEQVAIARAVSARMPAVGMFRFVIAVPPKTVRKPVERRVDLRFGPVRVFAGLAVNG